MKGIFLDIETTVINPDKHYPIDVGLIVVNLNDFSEICEYSSFIELDNSMWENADPIALSVNGLNNECVWCSKPIEVVGKTIEDIFETLGISMFNSFFICKNPSFDKQFFNKIISADRQFQSTLPYHWLDLTSMYWCKYFASSDSIPHLMVMTKDSIAKSLGLEPEEKPHRALNGARHLLECYKTLVKTDVSNVQKELVEVKYSD